MHDGGREIEIKQASIEDADIILQIQIQELHQFNNILADQKLIELARRIDEVNPKQKEDSTTTGSDVLEI